MKNLWNIRMRASKKLVTPMGRRRHSLLVTPKEIHISGAEGIYEESEVVKVVKKYIERALNHPRGKADKIVITIEEIREKPKTILALPITTIKNTMPGEGKKIAGELLKLSGISKIAIDRAFELIKKDGMRGAAIITAEKGNRLEPNRERGIRVSRLGITKLALKELSARLTRQGINTETVKEALILASKVSSSDRVVAELCVSDDPDYTTGYVASKGLGYVRIPHIKSKGRRVGGRVFFVKEGTNVRDIIEYFERRPVIIGKVSLCRGIISIDEILNCLYL